MIYLASNASVSRTVKVLFSDLTFTGKKGKRKYKLGRSPTPTVDYLIVAGGGHGSGGGGGAGGFLTTINFAVNANTAIPVVVGGQDTASSFSSSTAIQGGHGGVAIQYCPANSGIPCGPEVLGSTPGGGSGGGGSTEFADKGYNAPSNPGGTGTAGQGNNGGSSGAHLGGGGGGGGAGGGGGNGGTGDGGGGAAVGGSGGSGLSSSYSGASVAYAGGGGGNAHGNANGGSGGSGIGGNGSGNNTGAGSAGAINTGSGGGNGNNGGSGIVILRYLDSFPLATTTTGSPTYSNIGGYHIYKYTSPGTITF